MPKLKPNGKIIPRSAVPATREYPDKWAELWEETKAINKASGYAVKPGAFSGNINSLRCALRRAKMKGRVHPAIQVRFDGETAYLYRD